MNNYLQRAGWNTLAQIINKILAVFLSLIGVGLLTRYLGQKGFGDFTLTFAYLSFFAIAADLGLQLTMSRDLAKKNRIPSEIYGTFFWLKFFLAFASASIAITALFFIPYTRFIKIGIIIASAGVALGYINNFGVVVLQANLRLDLVAFIEILTKLFTTLLIYLMILCKKDFYSILNTILFGNLLGSLTIIFFLKKVVKFNLKFNINLAKKLLKRSIPVGIVSVLALLYFKIDTFLLSVLKGSAEVGIYGLAYKVIENLLLLWGFYMATAYPLMANLLSRKKLKAFGSIWKNSIKMALVSSASIVVIGWLLAPLIIKALGGSEFQLSVLPLRILLLSLPLFFINNLLYHSLLLKEKNSFLFKIIGSALIFNIILNVILIPKWTYVATSFNTFLTELFLLFLYLIINKKIKHSYA